MVDIYHKLYFGTSALPNAPKRNRQLAPNAMTRDTTGGCVFPTEWRSLRYPPVQVFGGHLPKEYWAVDLRISW